MAEWLSMKGFSQYAPTFKGHSINGYVAFRLSLPLSALPGSASLSSASRVSSLSFVFVVWALALFGLNLLALL